MIKRIIRLLSFMVSPALLLSCNSHVMFTGSAVMPSNIWQLDNIPDFSIPVDDTLSSNNISFSIRTGSSYPFRNIYLFVTTFSPDGEKITDTLNFYLADEKGNWYGKGFGDINELKLPYRQNVFFPASGTYQVNISHGMRNAGLEGVYDIGLRVEKTIK